MSEPVSTAAIEDVLSSIRRLVSEDNRREQPAEPVAEEPERVSKLVLTPSLRVAEAMDDGPDSAPELGAENSDPDKVAASGISLSMMAADDAPESETSETESVSSEDVSGAVNEYLRETANIDGNAPWSDPNATLFEAAQVEVLTDPVHIPEEVESEGVEEEREEESFAADSKSGKNQQREHEAFDTDDEASGTDTDLIEDLAGDSFEEPGENEHQDAFEEGQPEPEETALESDNAPESEDFEASPIPDHGDDRIDPPLSERAEALETAIAQSPENWEPDGDIGNDYAGGPVEPMAWQDVEEDEYEIPSPNAADLEPEITVEDITDEVSEAVTEDILAQMAEAEAPVEEAEEPAVVRPIRPEPKARTNSSDPGEDTLDLTSEETFLDEESLRELVTDIVREELQGALGERITRNVRKLVRREIHRALASQNLE